MHKYAVIIIIIIINNYLLILIIIIEEVITLRGSGENGRSWRGKGRANDRTLTCNILRKKIVN